MTPKAATGQRGHWSVVNHGSCHDWGELVLIEVGGANTGSLLEAATMGRWREAEFSSLISGRHATGVERI